MASLGNFNPDEHKDNYEPLPAGRYVAIIVKSENKDSKSGGTYLKLEVDIVEGQYKGRKLFANLNLVNANDMAVKIAKTELANICRAVGVMRPKDSSELHNKPISIRVAIQPERDGFPASNVIKGWDALATNPTPVNPPPAAAPASKPWEKPAKNEEEVVF